MKNAVRSRDACDHPPKRLERDIGSPDVFINGRHALRTDDVHRCAEHGPEKVKRGISGVFINDRRAVGAIDHLLGGGTPDRISTGSPDTFYGEEAFGTATKALKEAWCKWFKEFQKRWSTLTKEERKQELDDAITRQAEAAGMPPPFVVYDRSDEYAGVWNYPTWSIHVSEKMLQTQTEDAEYTDDIFAVKTPTPRMFCRIGMVVAHELRHQESSWYAMRLLLQKKANGEKLSHDEEIELARIPDFPRTEAAKQPLEPGSPQELFAINARDDYFTHWGACGKYPYKDSPGGREASENDVDGCCGGPPLEKWKTDPPQGLAVGA